MNQPKPAPRAKVPIKLGMPKGNAALHASKLARALAAQESKAKQQNSNGY
jgi:hypothetical protein